MRLCCGCHSYDQNQTWLEKAQAVAATLYESKPTLQEEDGACELLSVEASSQQLGCPGRKEEDMLWTFYWRNYLELAALVIREKYKTPSSS